TWSLSQERGRLVRAFPAWSRGRDVCAPMWTVLEKQSRSEGQTFAYVESKPLLSVRCGALQLGGGGDWPRRRTLPFPQRDPRGRGRWLGLSLGGFRGSAPLRQPRHQSGGDRFEQGPGGR